MPYYDTIDEDLARAKEILTRGKPSRWEQANFTPEVIEALRKVSGGTIYGGDVYAAYKLLESFVEEIERLRGQVQKDDQAIARLLGEVERLRHDGKMLATVVRHTTLAIADLPEDWEGSVSEGVERMNARIAQLDQYLEQIGQQQAIVAAIPTARIDHNGECLDCDEQAGHAATCPYLVALEAAVAELRATSRSPSP